MGYIEPSGISDDTVAASDLVRHFGQWQRRALQAPVYVLHHGRPQLVLSSLEFMRALVAPKSSNTDENLTDLLDALTDPVLVCDAAATIIAAGRAARLHFGKAAQPGARLDAILPAEAAAFVGAIVMRVAGSGIAERTELPAVAGAARLELVIEPGAAGVVIVGRAAGVADARDAALSRAAGLAGAIASLPDHAIATIGLRGYLVAPDASLSRLGGLSPQALSSVRAASLFSVASRIGVSDALEAVFTGGPPVMVEAELLTASGSPLPVSVGLAPLRRGLVIDAVQAVIAKCG